MVQIIHIIINQIERFSRFSGGLWNTDGFQFMLSDLMLVDPSSYFHAGSKEHLCHANFKNCTGLLWALLEGWERGGRVVQLKKKLISYKMIFCKELINKVATE